MSVGSKIVQLREALIMLLPHATNHSLRCKKYPCTCNLERALQTAHFLVGAHPGRTGGPSSKQQLQETLEKQNNGN